MAAKKKPASFEAGLAELEQLVAQMEGEMPLEAAMAAYERGMKLHAELLSQLDAGEARLKILSEGEAKA
ncbi:MAG: exodeoxyribonuclease VII small subunit [Oscillospiraceae bacterium]|jgi:exodeoxyribonuclease VII small subunit|nr:exodeoxyribonuclease VII small subunit [Oscillospiraceae bacterium]